MTIKINIDGYTVEVKAKNTLLRDKYNKKDTMAFLNSLACRLADLADYMENDKLESARVCAQYVDRDRESIHETLDKLGLYDCYKGV